MSRDDTIYRRAAIEALLEKGQNSKRYRLGDIWELNFDEIREAIATVPPAEPEIIYCKDCVHNKSEADAGNALCELYYGMTDQMGYCHKGERGDAMNEVQ